MYNGGCFPLGGDKVNSKEQDFYQNLRMKMREWSTSSDGSTNKWAEYLMFAPDLFHLLCKLVLDKSVYVSDKTRLLAAIAYFISPVDLVPEALLGPAGFVDDIALAAYVINSIIKNTDAEVVSKHWAGDGEVLGVIQSILGVADEMVGRGLWKKLKKKA
jgi:uncharacterized membrane protein YkvA (DUF1232 family)